MDEITGDSAKKSIRLKMKYLFTVLERYTWLGTETKKPFKSLKSLNNLLYQSVREQFGQKSQQFGQKGHQKYKLHEYQSYMVQWLKHSRSRQRTVTYSYPDQKKFDDSEDELTDDEFDSN